MKKWACLGLGVLLLSGLSACHLTRAIGNGLYPRAHDAESFKKAKLTAANEPFTFYRASESCGSSLMCTDWSDVPGYSQSLDELFDNHNTEAFVIIRNDTILYETYRQGNTSESLLPSYSVAKSFMSALLGIAIDKGHINLYDPISHYLPELLEVDADFGQIQIRHLLHHTSGLKNSIWIDARIYYGKDIYKALPHLGIEQQPGSFQEYNNMNTQLLGLAIEKAVGEDLDNYFIRKLWQPMGAGEGFWSTDDKTGTPRAFCCLNLRPVDYAKLGMLYMNKGQWQGRQIVPAAWVDYTLQYSTELGSSIDYNACWYMGLKEYGDYMAIGLYHNYIYVYPEKNIVMVLLNDKEKAIKGERAQYPTLFRSLVDQL